MNSSKKLKVWEDFPTPEVPSDVIKKACFKGVRSLQKTYPLLGGLIILEGMIFMENFQISRGYYYFRGYVSRKLPKGPLGTSFREGTLFRSR